ncbi:Beta-galactosidase C-terminal domain, partial [Clostridium perfringens]
DYLVAVNHRDTPSALAVTGHELLTDAVVDGSHELPGGAVAVIRIPRDRRGGTT